MLVSTIKEELKRLLSRRGICTLLKNNIRNDIFTVCELPYFAYHTSVAARNTVAGFCKIVIWSDFKQGCEPEVVFVSDSTSAAIHDENLGGMLVNRQVTNIMASSADPTQKIESYKDLYSLFLHLSKKLCSVGKVVEGRTISVSKATGATLIIKKLLSALRKREVR